MRLFKRLTAVSLAALMIFVPAYSASAAKDPQVAKTVTVPMIKEGNQWKIDPLFSFIGIKNMKATSEVSNLKVSHPAKLKIDTQKTKYALILKQAGVIVPKGESTKTPNITVNFWIKGNNQKTLYTKHKVVLNFVKRKSPIASMKIGKTNFDVSAFDTSNTAKFYKYKDTAWRTLNVTLQPYYKNLKLVAIGKDGHNWVIRSTSKSTLKNCSVNLKLVKAIQIRYTVDRTNKKSPYYNYLKAGVNLPSTGCLTLNIK